MATSRRPFDIFYDEEGNMKTHTHKKVVYGSTNTSCQVLINVHENRTVAVGFGVGWEGIPLNLSVNLVVFLVVILLFGWLRKTAHTRRKNSQTIIQRGWLSFVYGDRKYAKRSAFQTRRRDHHQHDLESVLLLPPDPGCAVCPNKRLDRRLSPRTRRPKDMTKEDFERQAFDKEQVRQLQQEELDDEASVTSQEDKSSSANPILEGHHCASNDPDKRIPFYRGLIRLVRRIWHLIFKVKEEDIFLSKGIDAAQYLRFQLYLIVYLLVLAVLCISVILPVNMNGGTHKGTFARTTMSNISHIKRHDQTWLLWFHVVGSGLMIPFGIGLMHHFRKSLRSHESGRKARRTLFVRKFPMTKKRLKNMQTIKKVIVSYLTRNVKGLVVEGVQFLFDTSKVKKVYFEHIDTINAVYYCQEYLDQNGEAPQIRPGPCGMGYYYAFCCCGCCQPTDGLIYYRDKEVYLEKVLEMAFKDTLTRPVGSLFLTFKSEKMCHDVFEFWSRERNRRWWNRFRLTETLGEAVRTLYNALKWDKDEAADGKTNSDADDQLLDDLDIHTWAVGYAPNPEDVNWDNITNNFYLRVIRNVVIYAILALIFVFCSTPPVILYYLNYLHVTELLRTGTEVVSPFLTEMVSPFLLMVFSSLLPLLVTTTSQYFPVKTVSQQNHRIMIITYSFLLLMVVVLPSMGLASVLELMKWVSGDGEPFRFECLFPVDNGAFFVNYVIQSAFISNGAELLRLTEVICYFFYTICWTRSAAEFENAKQEVTFDFYFGTRYPRLLTLFTVTVTYSFACPLITLAGLTYMTIKHLVDKYNLYYTHSPTKINEDIHSTAIMFFFLATILMQLQVVAFVYLKTSIGSNLTGVGLLLMVTTMVVFFGRLLASTILNCCFGSQAHEYCPCFNVIPREEARVERPNPTLSDSASTSSVKMGLTPNYCACLYLPPVLYELQDSHTKERIKETEVDKALKKEPIELKTLIPGSDSQAEVDAVTDQLMKNEDRKSTDDSYVEINDEDRKSSDESCE